MSSPEIIQDTLMLRAQALDAEVGDDGCTVSGYLDKRRSFGSVEVTLLVGGWVDTDDGPARKVAVQGRCGKGKRTGTPFHTAWVQRKVESRTGSISFEDFGSAAAPKLAVEQHSAAWTFFVDPKELS